MKNILAAACAALTALTGASAQNAMPGASPQAPISNPRGVMPNFDITTITPILDELSVVWETFDNGRGGKGLAADAGDGMKFVLQPTVCRADGQTNCAGLLIVAYLQGYADPTAVNDFNAKYVFTKSLIDPSDGQAMITRYEIADYGAPRGNFVITLGTFVELTAAFANDLAKASKTVSYDDNPANFSADRLNRQVKAQFTGQMALNAGGFSTHQFNLKEEKALLDALISNKAVLQRKIKNVTAD